MPGDYRDIAELLASLSGGNTILNTARAFMQPPAAWGDREGAIEQAVPLAGAAFTGGMPMATRGAAGMMGGKPPIRPETPIESVSDFAPVAAPPRPLSVSDHVSALNTALENKGEGFFSAFEAIKALPVADIKQVATELLGRAPSSGKEALQKIWNAHMQREIMRSKIRSMAGRSAG